MTCLSLEAVQIVLKHCAHTNTHEKCMLCLCAMLYFFLYVAAIVALRFSAGKENSSFNMNMY